MTAMRAAEEKTLTVGEAARRLNVTVEALLEVVYSGRLPARADAASGRMLINEVDLQAMQSDDGGSLGP